MQSVGATYIALHADWAIVSLFVGKQFNFPNPERTVGPLFGLVYNARQQGTALEQPLCMAQED